MSPDCLKMWHIMTIHNIWIIYPSCESNSSEELIFDNQMPQVDSSDRDLTQRERQGLGMVICGLFFPQKNKMKPTNPNADTYVEKQRCNTYLSQFPANPLVEHTDLTRWGDTLVGHPCLTLLRYALVRHSCMTLWFDTLVWHSSETLLLDTLVRHFLLDTLACHSCKTLLFNTLVGHFLLDTSYLTLFWDTLTWQSCETFLLDWHSSPTLLLDTLVRHSYLTLL